MDDEAVHRRALAAERAVRRSVETTQGDLDGVVVRAQRRARRRAVATSVTAALLVAGVLGVASLRGDRRVGGPTPAPSTAAERPTSPPTATTGLPPSAVTNVAPASSAAPPVTPTPAPTPSTGAASTAPAVTAARPAAAATTVAPFAGAPACPTHDPAAWHALWDASRGCHYDHTHHADPALADDLFGSAGAWWGGAAVGTPWAAPGEADRDDAVKYAVNRELPCTQPLAAPGCVRAFRLGYHLDAGTGLLARYHSFTLEAQVCPRAGGPCGIVRTGGWADFGVLRVPFTGDAVPLPGDPAEAYPTEPYRSANPASDRAFFLDPNRSCKTCRNDPTVTDNIAYWSSDELPVGRFPADQLGAFKLWVYDAPALVDPARPTELVWLCPDGGCRFNGTEHLVYEVVVVVPASLDTDGDGRVTARGFTDRWGDIVDGCAAPSFDCVPFEMVDAPVGESSWTVADALGYSAPGPGGTTGPPDFDVSPADEWWVRVRR